MKPRLLWFVISVLLPVAASGDEVAWRSETFGEGPLLLLQPRCVRVGPTGRVYLLQGEKWQVRGGILTPDGKLLRSFGVPGRRRGEDGSWFHPASLRPTRRGELLVADTGGRRILLFDRDGGFKRVVAAGSLKGPTDVVQLPSGDLVVCDSASSRVLLISAAGTLKRVIASPGKDPDQVSHPFSLGLDREGDLWIVDTLNRRLIERGRDFSVKRVLRPQAADGPLLRWPSYVDFDVKGNVFVADDGRECVFWFSPDGKLVKRIGQTRDEPMPFSHISGVTVTRTGELLVSDVGRNGIFRFDAKGKLLGEMGMPNAGVRERRMVATAVGADESFFGVQEQPGCTIASYAPDGTLLREFGGHGKQPGKFRRPRAATVGADGHLYIADSQNHNVTVYRADGILVRVFGGYGKGPADLHYPRAIAVAKDGRVFVGDAGNRRVQVYRADGTFLHTFARDVNPDFIDVDDDGNCVVYDDANASVTTFDAKGKKQWTVPVKGMQDPMGAVLAPDGRVWVFDRQRGRIVAFDARAEPVEILKDPRLAWGGPLARGRDGRFFVGWGRAVCRLKADGSADPVVTGHRDLAPGKLFKPNQLALVATDELAVRNADARSVDVFGRDGTYRRSLPLARADAGSLATTSKGELLLLDSFDGTLSRADADGKMTVLIRNALLKSAESCTLTPNGDLFVLSPRHEGVVRRRAAGGELAFLRSGRGEKKFRWPRAFTVTPAGDVLVVDWRRSTVFCYGADFKFKWRLRPKDPENGNSRNGVTAIRVDRAGNLYLLSKDGNCVLKYDRERKHVATFRPDAQRLGPMKAPQAMCIDETGTLYVADTGNNRIVVFKPE